jgi:hypothetical protein
MLAGTPYGDAYTFAELERMFAERRILTQHDSSAAATIQQVVISEK